MSVAHSVSLSSMHASESSGIPSRNARDLERIEGEVGAFDRGTLCITVDVWVVIPEILGILVGTRRKEENRLSCM